MEHITLSIKKRGGVSCVCFVILGGLSGPSHPDCLLRREEGAGGERAESDT